MKDLETAEMESPMAVLYSYYAERYPINNGQIWEKYNALTALLEGLPPETREAITNAVALLVAEHEQEAFTRGAPNRRPPGKGAGRIIHSKRFGKVNCCLRLEIIQCYRRAGACSRRRKLEQFPDFPKENNDLSPAAM